MTDLQRQIDADLRAIGRNVVGFGLSMLVCGIIIGAAIASAVWTVLS